MVKMVKIVCWMPSQEEYYEYNYYRMHGKIEKSADGSTLKLIINLPARNIFITHSVTINPERTEERRHQVDRK